MIRLSARIAIAAAVLLPILDIYQSPRPDLAMAAYIDMILESPLWPEGVREQLLEALDNLRWRR